LRIALAELFTDQVIPSGGLGGTLLVASALQRRDVSREASSAAVVVSLLGFYVAQVVLVGATFVALATRGRFHHFTAVVVIGSVVVAIATPLIIVLVATRGLSRLPKAVRRLSIVKFIDEVQDAPRDVITAPKVLGEASVWRAAILLLDGATLSAGMSALGHPFPFVDAVAALVLATVAASVSFLPGGLGSFEALSTGLLVSLGAPFEVALPATLLMRGFSFWLPMLPGVWFANRELKRAESVPLDHAQASAHP
jgi:uncharacterized protein (TIRG00374 family)